MTVDIVAPPVVARARPAVPPRQRGDRRRGLARGAQSALERSTHEGMLLFVASTALYLTTGTLMVQRNVLFADALSRVANGYFTAYSRDPHLPAIGFVWNPLPSLSVIPLFPFGHLFPDLVRLGFAGVISSAVCMGLAVSVMAGCLAELGVPRGWRLGLSAAFALQPMLLLYGGSGLSEPMLLLCLLLVTRSMLVWLKDGAPQHLVGAGLALALAYLTRYEAVGTAVLMTPLVALVSFRRAPGQVVQRLTVVLNDLVLVAGPFAFMFAVWAVLSRVIVGAWFPTFTSQYGNSAQVSSGKASIQAVTGSSWVEIAGYVGGQITALAPLLLPLLVLAVVVALVRRRGEVLVLLAVLGGVLLFDDAVLLQGRSFGWLRFQITAIPLAVLLAGTLLAAVCRTHRRPEADEKPLRHATSRRRALGHAAGGQPLAVAACAALLATSVIAWPTQFKVLTTVQGALAREEAPMLRSVFFPSEASHEDRRSLLIFTTERSIAAYLDSLHLPQGSILTDTAYAYSVVLASKYPKQFVITSDRDFPYAVEDPTGHHIRYMLVPSPGLGRAEALQRQWPGLYQNGSRVGTLVAQWKGAFYGDWRLYRVRGS